MSRCETCHKDISTNFPDVQYNLWLKLMNYFEHEFDEDEITQATYEKMTDALMSVKSTLQQEKD